MTIDEEDQQSMEITQPPEHQNGNQEEEKENNKIKVEGKEINNSTTANNEKKKKKKKQKNKKNKKNKKEVEITDADFGPIVDFTKNEGFVYDPEKAALDSDDIQLKKRQWEIPDVRSIAYLRRLGRFRNSSYLHIERKHNKIVHGLASVRKLTPKQIFKEEMRELVKYNEDVREEIQQEHIRNGDWEYYDNEVYFTADNVAEMNIPLLDNNQPREIVEEVVEEEKN